MWSRAIRIGSVFGLLSLALAGAVASDAGAASAPAQYYDWPNYQGNSLHDGLAPGKGLPTATKRLWSAQPTHADGAFSSTIIAGGTVFTSEGGQFAPIIHAYEARTGREQWSFTFPGDEHAPGVWLAYDNGRLFGQATNGSRGAFDAKTGEVIWGDFTGRGYYTYPAPITAYRGVLYVLGGGSPYTSLVYLDEATGAQKFWENLVNDTQGAPTVYASAVFADLGHENVYRYSTSGVPVWAHLTSSTGRGAAPVLHDSKLYAHDQLMEPVTLSASSGKVLGSLKSYYSPAFSGTTAIVIDQSGRMAAVSTTDGHTIWQAPAENIGVAACTTAPVISLNGVYCGRYDGTIRGYHLLTGKQIWSGDAGASFASLGNSTIDGRLAVGNGVLAGTTGGRLTVFG